MRRQKLYLRMTRALAIACLTLLVAAPVVQAALPYNPVPIHPILTGKAIVDPKAVFGKEYSHHPDVDITPVIDGDRVFVHFGAANYDAHVYLNGTTLGSPEGGFTPFNVAITEQVRSTSVAPCDQQPGSPGTETAPRILCVRLTRRARY